MAVGYRLYRQLAEKSVIVPYLENSFMSGDWPDTYTITVPAFIDRDNDGWFHPSSHCLGDPRWLYYQVHPDLMNTQTYPRRTSMEVMTLAVGTVMHAIIQEKFKIAGLTTDSDIEIKLTDEVNHARGSLDFAVTLPNSTRWPVELKTMNSMAYSALRFPKPEWVAQLNMYMDWMGHDEGIILVFQLGYPYNFREFKIRRDTELLKKIYGKWELVREAVALGVLPDHCCPLDSPKMTSCSARNICWLAEVK